MISGFRKNILVTGGAGFIGSHLVEALLARGDRVVVYDNFSSGHMSNLQDFSSNLPGSLEVIEGDMRDAARVLSLFRRFQPEVVFHLAAFTSVGGSIDDPELCEEVNIGGLVNLLTAIEYYGAQKLIFSSTSALYGDFEPPHEEDLVVHHRSHLERLGSPYAKSKLIGESLIMQSSIESVIFRFFNVYGERQPLNGGYPAVIPSFFRDIEETGIITIYGNGLQTRDFIYAGDVAQALVDSMRPGFSGIYNLGSGRALRIHELAEIMGDLCAGGFKFKHEPARPGEVRESYAAMERLKRDLGFSSRVHLYEGLERLVPSIYPLSCKASS